MNTFTLCNSKHALVAAIAGMSFASVVATLSFIAVAPVALASELNDRPAMTVHYSDLNLNTQVGVATLYNRIRSAAQQVCGNTDSRRLEQVSAAEVCVDHAIASSVSAVGSPQLNSEYSARTGGGRKIVVASLR